MRAVRAGRVVKVLVRGRGVAGFIHFLSTGIVAHVFYLYKRQFRNMSERSCDRKIAPPCLVGSGDPGYNTTMSDFAQKSRRGVSSSRRLK